MRDVRDVRDVGMLIVIIIFKGGQNDTLSARFVHLSTPRAETVTIGSAAPWFLPAGGFRHNALDTLAETYALANLVDIGQHVCQVARLLVGQVPVNMILLSQIPFLQTNYPSFEERVFYLITCYTYYIPVFHQPLYSAE